MVFITTIMMTVMKEYSKTELSKEKELIYSLMVINIKVLGKMIKEKGKMESMNFMNMVKNMKVILRRA